MGPYGKEHAIVICKILYRNEKTNLNLWGCLCHLVQSGGDDQLEIYLTGSGWSDLTGQIRQISNHSAVVAIGLYFLYKGLLKPPFLKGFFGGPIPSGLD